MPDNRRASTLIAAIAAIASAAQAQGPKATLEKQLEAQYALTTPTADKTDLVTTGSVLILQKKGLSAGAASNKVPTQNTYKDGQIKAGAATAVRRFGSLPGIGLVPGIGSAAGTAAGAAGGSRDFVNGEKLYVTKIDVDRGKETITFALISDSYGDAGRYTASLRFEFPKGTLAKADLAQVEPTIDQALKVASPDAQNAGAAQDGQPAAAPVPAPAATAEAPLPPIAPPPPPADEPQAPPQSISLGQTPEQVVAILGQPQRIVDLGAKKTYIYKDMKVVFTNGKMTDAQ